MQPINDDHSAPHIPLLSLSIPSPAAATTTTSAPHPTPATPMPPPPAHEVHLAPLPTAISPPPTTTTPFSQEPPPVPTSPTLSEPAATEHAADKTPDLGLLPTPATPADPLQPTLLLLLTAGLTHIYLLLTRHASPPPTRALQCTAIGAVEVLLCIVLYTRYRERQEAAARAGAPATPADVLPSPDFADTAEFRHDNAEEDRQLADLCREFMRRGEELRRRAREAGGSGALGAGDEAGLDAPKLN